MGPQRPRPGAWGLGAATPDRKLLEQPAVLAAEEHLPAAVPVGRVPSAERPPRVGPVGPEFDTLPRRPGRLRRPPQLPQRGSQHHVMVIEPLPAVAGVLRVSDLLVFDSLLVADQRLLVPPRVAVAAAEIVQQA